MSHLTDNIMSYTVSGGNGVKIQSTLAEFMFTNTLALMSKIALVIFTTLSRCQGNESDFIDFHASVNVTFPIPCEISLFESGNRQPYMPLIASLLGAGL